ncbi:MAG: heme-binding protein, partial [Chloroflexi bacterium]|nr:heme-binding protein [Chloroflexota bacterium]
MANVTLAEAVKMCDAAIAKAEELGIRIAVTVVDSGMNLVAAHKMDGTLILAIEGSRGKAVASVIFGQPSGELEGRADRPVMRSLQIQMNGRFIMGQGARPIM